MYVFICVHVCGYMCQRVLVKVWGQLLGSGAQTQVIRLCNKLYPPSLLTGPRLAFCVKGDLLAWKAQNRRGEGPFLLITFPQPPNVLLMAHLDDEEELLGRMLLMTLSNFTRSWYNHPDLYSLNSLSMRMLWAGRQSLKWKSISRATWTTIVRSLNNCGSWSQSWSRLDSLTGALHHSGGKIWWTSKNTGEWKNWTTKMKQLELTQEECRHCEEGMWWWGVIGCPAGRS